MKKKSESQENRIINVVVEQQQNKYDYDNNIDTKICDPRIFNDLGK